MRPVLTQSKIIVITILATLLSSFSFSQSYHVAPVSSFLPEYQGKHQLILADIERRTDLTLAQKLVIYEGEVTKLKQKFKDARIAEYNSKSTVLSVTHSCTSESSGGTKNCGEKSVSAPIAELHTQPSWLKVNGTNKGTRVSENGSIAYLKMTVAGKGKNKGTLSATYKYRPESVLSLTERDSAELFSQVVK